MSKDESYWFWEKQYGTSSTACDLCIWSYCYWYYTVIDLITMPKSFNDNRYILTAVMFSANGLKLSHWKINLRGLSLSNCTTFFSEWASRRSFLLIKGENLWMKFSIPWQVWIRWRSVYLPLTIPSHKALLRDSIKSNKKCFFKSAKTPNKETGITT